MSDNKILAVILFFVVISIFFNIMSTCSFTQGNLSHGKPVYVIKYKTNAPYYNKTYHRRTDIYYTTEFSVNSTTNCITFKSYDYTEKTLCGNYEIEKQY